MTKNLKFIAISLGGFALMIFIATVIASIAGVDESTMSEFDLASDWMWYRIFGYALMVALWPQICKYLTRPRFDVQSLSEEEWTSFKDSRNKDIEYLKKQWWKLVALFVFFEGVMIQQLGF